ncbi:hypothetical protein A3762_09750 [Oleiphilus sp. HI0125]|nr:hypothetical protein A3762_09750 [Oleiphilus sp. HI0125]
MILKAKNQLSLVLATLALMPVVASAELRPISDEELGEVSGQAAVAFDVDQIGSTSYTRVTLGMEAEIQMNIDNLEAGRYAKTGESLEADLQVSNLGLGSISTDSSKVQLDGNTYDVNEIIPFELNDPYFEIARDDNNELIGFRIGFGEARGQLSGDFGSISGNVEMDIVDDFGTRYESQLLNAAGDPDNSRSTNFGVAREFTGGTTDCSTGWYCYDLGDFKTLDIGERNADTGAVEYTEDFFIGFQKQATEWMTSDGSLNTDLGAFINLPTAMQIDMNSGLNAGGTDRVRLEYIDRGNGLF